jgi:hypothetical protein
MPNVPRPIFSHVAAVKSTVRRIARRQHNGNSSSVGGRRKEKLGARPGSESGFAGNENVCKSSHKLTGRLRTVSAGLCLAPRSPVEEDLVEATREVLLWNDRSEAAHG